MFKLFTDFKRHFVRFYVKRRLIFGKFISNSQQFSSVVENMELLPHITKLSVLSFNTWNSGNNVKEGLIKIARHIIAQKPDIVGLQEMYDDKIDDLIRLLKNQYYKCSNHFGSTYIISRLPILEEYESSNGLMNAGCRIRINSDNPDLSINVWNIHLHWTTYGPYAARDNDLICSETLLNCERKNHDPPTSRVHNFENLLKHEPFRKCLDNVDETPLILLGDFNCPSHLDWTESCRFYHHGWTFDWPVSKMAHEIGLKDSYREVHKDESLMRGITWSPVVKFCDSGKIEPEDRIDFIYYGGKSLTPTASVTYPSVAEQIAFYPNHSDNDWPSDHCAVMTNFEIKN